MPAESANFLSHINCARKRQTERGRRRESGGRKVEKCWKIYANLAPKLKSISGSPCESQQELAKSEIERDRKRRREGERYGALDFHMADLFCSLG